MKTGEYITVEEFATLGDLCADVLFVNKFDDCLLMLLKSCD